MIEPDDAVLIEPNESPTASVIWLHGLGADGHDFEAVVPELNLQNARELRFIFPHAPHRPVTINGGAVMRAWYDIVDADLERSPDESGVHASELILKGYIATEVNKGIPTERIILAGFSQGGAIALHTALRYPRPLAGILALSTYLPLHQEVTQHAHSANRSIPIFMAHGSSDPMIPLAQAENSRDFLRSLGYLIEWHTYPMPHAVIREEIRDIGDWFCRLLA